MWKPNRGQQVHEARQALARARDELHAVSRDFTAASRAARDVPNRKDLSPEGVRKAQREALDRARAAAVSRVDGQRASIDAAREALRKLGESAVPDTAGELRRGRLWERTRALLESGVSPAKVIADSTDPEVLLTLRDELPSWLQAQRVGRQRDGLQRALAGQYEKAGDAGGILRSIDRRLAETAEGDEAASATARIALETEVSVADLHHTHVSAELSGHSSPMTTSIALLAAEGRA